MVATLAIVQSTRWPVAVVIPFTLLVGVLVGSVSRAIAGGPASGWAGVAGRTTVAVAVGLIIGELAAVVLLAGSIDRRIDEQAARSAESVPPVAAASAALERTRLTRAGLDDAVAQARRVRDEALVVARCEFNPSPACPETRITGVPGTGPETRTAQDFLSDAQQQLDGALAARDQRAAGLDSRIVDDERALALARAGGIADADRGLGARWVAMNGLTSGEPASMLLRLLSIGFVVLLILLPLILKQWRGETAHDRRSAARAERERAELDADTAVALKRAEVRAAAEMMWAEQQLASARLAVEAQTEIDRERQRRRVLEELEAAVPARLQRAVEPAELATTSRSAAELPAGADDVAVQEPGNLPARQESGGAVEPSGRGVSPFVPKLPDITMTAARLIRPFVPPIIASAIDTTTRPLRGTRQIVEEVEEIHFSLTRTRTVSVHSESSEVSVPRRTSADRVDGDPRDGEVAAARSDSSRRNTARASIGSAADAAHDQPELTELERRRAVGGAEGPRQLPSAE